MISSELDKKLSNFEKKECFQNNPCQAAKCYLSDDVIGVSSLVQLTSSCIISDLVCKEQPINTQYFNIGNTKEIYYYQCYFAHCYQYFYWIQQNGKTRHWLERYHFVVSTLALGLKITFNQPIKWMEFQS